MNGATLVSMASALALVAASAGWGRLVARWARVEVDGGLVLSWGLAALLALGGGVTALGIATAPVLVGIEALGVGALLLPPRPGWPRLTRGQALFMAAAAVVLAIRVLLATQLGAFEPCDDLLGYQPLVQQLLQAGDLEAPFSLRRLAAYGGQTVLQAFAVPSGAPDAMSIIDTGLAPIFLLGLAWSFLRRHGEPRPLPLGFALLLGLGLVVRTNTASQATSLVFFLAVARTLYMVVEADRRIRLCVILGLLAAAASSLRHLNMPFPVLLMLAFLPRHIARWGWRAALADGAVAAASWCVFLAPWMAALYASSGTPLYPLIRGYHNSGLDFASATGGWRQVAANFVGALQVKQLLVVVLLMPVSFFIPRDRTIGAIQCAALIGAVVIVAAFPSAEAHAMARYVQPTLATAFFLAILTALATGVVSTPLVRRGMAVAVICGVGQGVYAELGALVTPPASKYPMALMAERLAAYAEVQPLVPAGTPIFVYVSTPFGFDSARNRIFNADEPGPVSPPPGMPFFKGADAVAAYLQAQGIHHVVFEDFDSAVTWCICPSGIASITEPLWQPWKPYLFDLMANLRELARTRRVLYGAHGVTMIDLDAPVPLRTGLDRHIP